MTQSHPPVMLWRSATCYVRFSVLQHCCATALIVNEGIFVALLVVLLGVESEAWAHV